MTLTLTPSAEVALRALAEQHNQAPEAILEALVVRAAAEAERERQETLNALRQSAAQFAAGDWVALEDLEQDLTAQAQSRRQPVPLPSPHSHAA